MAKNFRAANGKYYTKQLFWEEWVDLPIDMRKMDPVFTLYHDKPNLINFGKRYVALRDPTGYKISQDLLGEYALWTVLMNSQWFRAAKEIWDRELDAALAAEGMTKIRELMAEGGPAQQIAAAKYLASRDYKKDPTQGKGRPNKEQVERAAQEQAVIDKQLQDDYARIRIVKS